MKRQFNIAMIAVFLFMAIASPVSAAEIDTDTWFPVLDYTTVDDSGVVFITVNQSNTVGFDLFGLRACYAFDILCNITGDRTNLECQATVNGRTFDLNIINVGDYLYRIYGNVAGGLADDELQLTFSCASTCYVTFYQVDILSVKNSYFPATGQMYVTPSQYNNWVSMPNKDTSVTTYLTVEPDTLTDVTLTDYLVEFYCNYWYKYDYIDFTFDADIPTINSIRCYINNYNIPFDISILDLENNSFITYSYTATGGIDIGEIFQSVNSTRVAGYIRMYVKDLDPDTTLKPYVQIRGTYDKNNTTAPYFTLKWVTGYVQVDDINPLHYYFADLYSKLGNWFNRVVNAINGDSAAGEDFQNQLAPEIEQIQQDQAIIDSVQKPYIGNLDINDWSNIVQGTNVFSLVISSLMGSQSLTMIIGVGVSCMIVSYLIFGKR